MNCFEKQTNKTEEEKEKKTTAAKEVSMDAATATVLSDLQGIFTLKWAFPQLTTLFHITADCLWYQFSQTTAVHSNEPAPRG